MNTNNQNNINVYMKRKIKEATQKNTMTIDQDTFLTYLNVYNLLISTSDHFVCVIFDMILKNQGKSINPIIVADISTGVIKNMNNKIKSLSNDDKLVFYPIKFRLGSNYHANLLVIDTTHKKVYRLDPIADNIPVVDNILEKYFVSTQLQYMGDIKQYISCDKIKNTLRLQNKFKGEYCVSYMLFSMYLLSLNYNKTKNILVFNNNSNIITVKKLSDGKIRFLFAKFMQKIFFVYLHLNG